MGSDSKTLILSVSPEGVNNPYYFNSTRKKIYSLEELIYHCYYYWRQSIDDFLSGTIELWIEQELGLKYLSSRIQKIKDNEKTITNQYSCFLKVIDYFEENEIVTLQREIFFWENMDQWKKYKEKADYFLENYEYQKAINSYKDALEINEDIAVINNLGVAYMKYGKYVEAMECFKKAHIRQEDNVAIILNTIEVLMLQGEYNLAYNTLQKFESIQNNPEVLNVYGQLEYLQQNYDKALEYFSHAHEVGDHFISLIKTAYVYSKQGKYKESIKTIESIENKENTEYYYEYAYLHYEIGNIKEAIIKAEKSVEYDKKNRDVWLLLIKLYKQNKNLELAQRAILKVFEMDSDNEQAKLEYATLKKSNGFIKDYQEMLKTIVSKWKQIYRNS